MVLLDQDEGTKTPTAGKVTVAAVTVAAVKAATTTKPAVGFVLDKTKVGAVPNSGAGSPVSLAAILRKTGLHKRLPCKPPQGRIA